MSNIIKTKNISYDAKFDAFEYQVEAYNAIKDLEYSAVFHEQGLGKTKIGVDLALYWLNNKGIDCVLVVTKKQLVNNWIEELGNHTFLRARVLGTNKGSNYRVLNSATQIIVTNFETIVSEKERIKLFLKTREVAIIIDESTKIKNPDTKMTQTFFELSDLFRFRTIMTGTPVANRPYDIWSQIFFLDHGKALGEDFNDFKNSTDLNNKLSRDSNKRVEFEKTVSSIFSKISSFTVRETKASSGIKLPKKEYIKRIAFFEDEQRKKYHQILRELSTEINKDGETIIDDDSECLKRLLRLNQVASNPRLLDESYEKTSGKEIILNQLIDEVIERDEKCIIWTSFIGNIEEFADKYKKYNSQKIHGGLSIEARNDAVKEFKNNNECKLLFATPQSAKEGLTLTVANNVIFYDRTFNLDDYLQAQDRIHRISQDKKCRIYNILIEESIDKWIDALLGAKQYAAFLAQGDIEASEFSIKMDYSYGEIIKEVLTEGKINE